MFFSSDFTKECEKMKVFGIVAEYNPFHNGHMYLIDQAKRHGADAVVAVMSGNWVQRGDTAVISKFARTRQALECGVDLVAELPTHWAMATAQKFAEGALEILENLGIDTLIFGSECGDTERLIKTAYCVRSNEFSRQMRENLDIGMTPAKARESAVETLCGNGELLRSPNDTLAVEYICAAKALNSKCRFLAVKRQGTSHDSSATSGEFCSASALREMILSNKLSDAKKYMPEKSFDILYSEFENGKISDIKALEKPILTALRTTQPNELKQLPDISEGIENRLFSAARMSSSLSQLFDYAATKRYTNARLRRLVLSAFLRAKAENIPNSVQYIRVLGCNAVGAEVLKSARETTKIPIIMRSTALKDNTVFEFETRATDIYSLSQAQPDPCGSEFTNGVIIKKD